MSTTDITRSADASIPAILLCGFPAAGKSEAAEYIAAQTGGTVVSMGDIVRESYESYFDEPPTESNQLGAFSTMQRKNLGPDWIANRIVGQYRREEIEVTSPLVVDSIRCPEEVTAFRWAFSPVHVVFVSADFHTRYDRITDRAREGEDGFAFRDLRERDGRELGWGLRNLMDSSLITDNLDNYTFATQLKKNVDRFIASHNLSSTEVGDNE